MSSSTRQDTVRQSVVVFSAVVAVVGAFVGSGAAGGTPIAEAAGGALGADSTLVAPAGGGLPAEVWGVAVVVVAGLVGVLLAVYGRGRLAPMFSLSWGIAWVAVSRLTGTLPSTPVATTAIAVAAVVIIATVVARLRSGELPRR
ncbi:hypothetical protein [Subtercola frigoramans]|uniref:Uncharacterized protein n=1 Tax=Subtercola frigoramans TaxID=120298 RepID=A0ABS2L2D2_9MICO|nr:hypothetical protein [Subtercola frigoramans]MBM7471066.1 hypothetical protein [Subtercola frigoramans]